MANPRKFSEKIALQKQKQAEGTAEFEKIMKEVYATKMDESQVNQKILECCLTNANDGIGSVASNCVAGAGNVVGGGSGAGSGASGGGASPEGTAGNGSGIGGGGSGGSPTAYRESRGRSVGVGPMRRPSERKQDRSPYGSSSSNAPASAGACMGMMPNGPNSAYLSPPMDSSWRRSNSDSALHQTLISAEGGFGSGVGSGIGGMTAELGTLQTNYQHHSQRSHSPNIGRSFSPQAQRRKGNMNHHLQQQQQQQQQQHHHQQQQHHMHLQQQHHMQHQQQQQQHQQHLSQHHQPQLPHQQQLQFNAKYPNCNVPTNSLFKTLQDQAMTFANTGSLPDLTSMRYAPSTQQHLMHNQQQQQQQQPQQQQQQQPQQQQQQTLSPILSPHNNNGHERDQSPSPFSPPGGGPPSPYHQQQHSPTSSANTPTAAQTSPHLSFTNLSVQTPSTAQNPAQSSSFSNLPTLGAASSAGNLTDYRQPLNPPSPGSSPGLLTSTSGHELHTSAPASPIRHPQTNIQQNVQGLDRYSPAMGTGNVDSSGYNSLNPSFHNHFEQFSLGDSNSSPEQQQQQQQQQQQLQQQFPQQSSFDFDEFINSSSQQQLFSQSAIQSKILDFNDLDIAGTNSNGSNATPNVTCSNSNSSNNNNLRQQSTRTMGQQPLLSSNNNSVNNSSNGGSSSSNMNGPGPTCSTNNNATLSAQQQNETSGAVRQDVLASPVPSPLGCVPSPSSPLPIPMSAQSSHHHHHQQLSLSLSQHSPHHSPLHSPHHSSPISMSSPSGVSPLGGPPPGMAALTSSNIVSSSTNSTNMVNALHNHHHQQQQQYQQQQQQHQHSHQLQQSSHANTPTAIPSIVFSDYSSNSDLLASLDLDQLGRMDAVGMNILSDENAMIADPTIEDSFRRDLN